MSLRDLNIFKFFQALQFQASHSRSFGLISPSLSIKELDYSPSLCLSSALGLNLFLFSVLMICKTLIWPLMSYSAVIVSNLIFPIKSMQAIDMFFYHWCHFDSRIMHERQSNCYQVPSSFSWIQAQLSILMSLKIFNSSEVSIFIRFLACNYFFLFSLSRVEMTPKLLLVLLMSTYILPLLASFSSSGFIEFWSE